MTRLKEGKMAMIRWEPVRELHSLQNEMNRLFGSFFDTPPAGNGAGRWLPAMDLIETPDEFVLRADLPGVADDDIKVELEDNVLTIAGERKAEHEGGGEGFFRLERAHGVFARTLTLPEGIDGERIAANFDRGVLEVRIPKPEARKPKRVSIGVGDRPGPIEGEATGGAGNGAGNGTSN